MERVITIMQNPRQYKIPDWFLNRQKDVKDGKYSQVRARRTPASSEEQLVGRQFETLPKRIPRTVVTVGLGKLRGAESLLRQRV